MDDTTVSVRLTQSEIDSVLGIPENWTNVPAKVLAYIDDLNVVEKIRHCDAVSDISTKRQLTHVHAPQSESFFNNIANRASELGMKVNEQKTQILCISAAKTADISSFVNSKTTRLRSEKQLKI